MAVSRICSVQGCGKPVKARQFCNAHYHRWSRHADPAGGGTAQGDPLKFLTSVVANTVGDDCILWPYARLPNGYGHLWVDGVDVLASRYVCEQRNGPPPSAGHEATHSCGSGHQGCIHPSHIRWGTHSENEQDKLDHGTDSRGEKNYGAILTEADVKNIRSLKGRVTGPELGELYRVSKWAIYSIWSRKTWAWLSE